MSTRRRLIAAVAAVCVIVGITLAVNSGHSSTKHSKALPATSSAAGTPSTIASLASSSVPFSSAAVVSSFVPLSSPAVSASTTPSASSVHPTVSAAKPVPKPPAPTHPAPAPAPPVVHVSRLFAATSLWNTRKTGLAFVAAANGVLSSDSYGLNNGAFDHPMYFASASDPETTFQLRGSYGNPSMTITERAPAGMRAASGSDGVLTVLFTDGTLLDMYGATVSGSSVNVYAYAESDGVNGPGFGNQSNYHVAGTTAIGSPQAAGTILARDISAGVIAHALSIAFDYGQLGGSGDGAGPAVVPAVANDDGGGPGPLPEGGLLVIPPGIAKPAGLSKAGSELWTAAQTYGVYITDQLSGDPRFYSDGSATVTNAFSGNDFTIVGRALRLAKTW